MKKLIFSLLASMLLVTQPVNAAMVIGDKLEIYDMTSENDAAVYQALSDYDLMLRVYRLLTKNEFPAKIKLFIMPYASRREALEKGLPTKDLPETWFPAENEVICQGNYKRGINAHELMHAFCHYIHNEAIKEEFALTVTAFLIDGWNPANQLGAYGFMAKWEPDGPNNKRSYMEYKHDPTK